MPIEGVIVKSLTKYKDDRGWLSELYRVDEVDEEVIPMMSYVSMTLPEVARGPHEHKEQTDYFCFLGPSTFKIYLWDNRPGSKSYKDSYVFHAGEDDPKLVIVPPGVVHAYKNVGSLPGIVYNAPNKLFKGEGKKEEVDEIRHEDDENSPYKIK